MHPFRPSSLRRAAVALTLTLVASGSAVSATTASASGDRSSAGPAEHGWFTSWAQPQQELAPTPLRDQSVRMITHLSQGGGALRVRIQNTFGRTPLTVDAATVGRSSTDGKGGPAIDGAVHAVTLDGRREVVVPPGGEVWSDATDLETRAQDDVAVSLSMSGTVTPGRHANAFRSNYLTPPGSGDHTAEASGSAYTQTVDSTYLVSAVDVDNPAVRGTIVVFGSSVVDGTAAPTAGQVAHRTDPIFAGRTTSPAASPPSSPAPGNSQSPTRASPARRVPPSARALPPGCRVSTRRPGWTVMCSTCTV
ncbi:hypothetical protein QF035_000677 [Streptomyces umbrinus]|uniref:Uncharacterized protein n=1 Tax=Streptomyces umbrinus TaxID=67370 RepID=A0ABU0SHR4_9ACTN|nr:hypothetical protein [Streptomyces umbrinus]MDQ1023095.1 hypothetical protein [Streptomyces umbrinus]